MRSKSYPFGPVAPGNYDVNAGHACPQAEAFFFLPMIDTDMTTVCFHGAIAITSLISTSG